MVTIGSWAGFWGDSSRAAGQLLRGADLDYLVGDHLAEITMALLARARMKDPQAGYVPDVVAALTPLLGEIAQRGVKVVTNGGGLNPAACAEALRAAGSGLRVAHLEGDDVRGRVNGRDMFTGEPLPAEALTANAYLGARPIAEALHRGADIVVTGRCADSAVVLGPLLHEFGWAEDDHDRLSAGSLIGHILECGPQATGGLFTDWWEVPGWEDMGYPVAECSQDGTAVITKPDGTGGLVTPATVAEQVLYEIGDPGAYVLPDVVCDWRDVRLEQEGPDRVRVSGARGHAPTPTYKATVTAADGFRFVATASFFGSGAAGRARRAGEAVVARAELLLGESLDASVEVLGAGDGIGRPGALPDAREAMVKIAARHADPRALELVAREVAPLALVAQGMTGLTSGRPRPQPVIRLFHTLVDKAEVPATVVLDGERHPVAATAATAPAPATAPLPEPAESPAGTVPLREIAHGRSGDKGNDVNIGVIARRPQDLAALRERVTAARVREVFGAWLEGDVRRYELPGLHAINIVLTDVLGGRGGTSSLRLDPQGKSYAAILLDALL